MGSKKLVYCCIAGILLGFIVPKVLGTDPHVSLMVGMIAGLGIGYLLDVLDEHKGKEDSRLIVNRKAAEANRLMEEARKGLEDGTRRADRDTDGPDTSDEEETFDETDEDIEEQAQKLSDAEELLRSARERMRDGF